MRSLCTIVGFMFVIHAGAQKQNLFYSSGTLQYSYELKNDKLDGIFLSYYPNGSIRIQGSFKAGKKSSLWQAWDSSGVLRTKRYFKSNSEFELLNEWTSNGEPFKYIQARRKRLQEENEYFNLHNEDSNFFRLYCREIVPDGNNGELFAGAFYEMLKSKINTGQIEVRPDTENYFRVLSPAEKDEFAFNFSGKYIQLEQHIYSLNCQKTFVDAYIGLVYKGSSGYKTFWLSDHEFRPFLSDLFPSIRDKFDDYIFSVKVESFTLSGIQRDMKKIDEDKKMSIILSEFDEEGWAWIYSIDKGEMWR